MEIRKALPQDAAQAGRLAAMLWPEHAAGELAGELEQLIRSGDGAVFLALSDGEAAGFAQCQLRRDYVEGAETSPVGYLEGIYVREPFRGSGFARALLRACEGWAREQGCREFASDCELDNEQSLRFHLPCGFREANRIICFVREL